jgi:hypothetical protein
MPFQEKLLFLDHVNFLIKLNLTSQAETSTLLEKNFYRDFKNKEEFEKDLFKCFNLISEDVSGLYSIFVII